VAEVKFCGLTREEDARVAAALGASFAGVIFAGGPRNVEPERARVILDAGTPLRRVGVFGKSDLEAVVAAAEEAELDIVQLHADPEPEEVAEVRAATGAEVWAVARIGAEVPRSLGALFEAADAVLLDARSGVALGGTGRTVPWRMVAAAIDGARRGRRLVLAGGLGPENVGEAIAVLAPDVVDVSSGVESSPGVKDHARMRAFAAAAKAAGAGG
jgi:phosphoribosylanthranilate isomerase